MKWEKDICVISCKQFRVLVEFASKDTMRENINKIGFDPKEARCYATDGHTLLMFEDMSPGDDRAQQIKAADPKFPTIDQVIPQRVSTSYHTEPAGFDPLYLARVALVGKSLQNPDVRMQPGPGPLDPIRFDFDDTPKQHTRAVIIIMPRRLP